MPEPFLILETPESAVQVAARLRERPLLFLDAIAAGAGGDGAFHGFCLGWDDCGAYVPFSAEMLEPLAQVLSDATVPKCGHGVKALAHRLLRHGVRLRGVCFDVMLAAVLLDLPHPAHRLEALSKGMLAEAIPSLPDQPARDALAAHAADRIRVLRTLQERLAPQVEAAGLWPLLSEVESPLTAVLAEMETHGILCDPDELLRQGEALGIRVVELRTQVHELSGGEFHLDSPKQLAEVLFDRLGLTPGKKTKTGYSTDAAVLEKLAAEEDPDDPRTGVPRLLIEYRHLQKLLGTYLGNLRESVDGETGRIYSTFLQIHTATGRMGSSNPNLQTVPVRTEVGRQIRKAFHAPPGHRLICADYSQIELRILAHLCEDPALLEAFAADQDIHTAVAAQVYGVPPSDVTRTQRDHAKTINFGIIYGVTPFGLARRIGGLDVAAAARLIREYKARFPGIQRFLLRCVRDAEERGYVCTIMGRRRAVPEVASSNKHTRALGERLAINSVVQGSGADLIKRAMVNIQARIDRDRLPLKLLLQIHDELVLETPAGCAEEHATMVREEMERAMDLRVPLKADAGIGGDWISAK